VIKNILTKDLILNAILFTDDQVIVTSTENEMQRVVYALRNTRTAIKCDLKIPINKTRTMAVKGKTTVLNNRS
jgi:hypothetical protein